MRVLLTGGCGYIGSHTALALVEAGHEPILFDNFCNSRPEVIDRLASIASRELALVEGDVRDVDAVATALSEHRIDAVVHFAGLKAVAESVADPLAYHLNNVGGMLGLLGAMRRTKVRRIVFSSSATVYGEPQRLPLDETHPTGAINPYGQGKLVCEHLLEDLARADATFRVAILRYFNPVGAHKSGLIGEDPKGIPNNLMPLLTRAATGEMPPLSVFGTDYPTPDGTAVRDYIHVVDLAAGHVAALDRIDEGDNFNVYNLGTGQGTSVLALIEAFEQATGVAVPRRDADRRPGDVAAMYASTDKAARELGWSATYGIADMCADSWRFAKRNR